MQLTTVREIYRDREAFLDKEITVGVGYEAYVTPRHSDLLCFMMEHFLRHYRLFIMIR